MKRIIREKSGKKIQGQEGERDTILFIFFELVRVNKLSMIRNFNI